jgi:alpha-N-arabinofuranosidase
MFSRNRGDVVLPWELATAEETPTTSPTTRPVETLFVASSREDASGDVIVKFVNTRSAPEQVKINLQGISTVTGGSTEVLMGQENDVNSIDDPMKVAPKQMTLSNAAPSFTHEFPAFSVTVLRIKTK